LTASELGEYLKKVVPAVAYHLHKVQKPFVSVLQGHENGEFVIAFSDMPVNTSIESTRKSVGLVPLKIR